MDASRLNVVEETPLDLLDDEPAERDLRPPRRLAIEQADLRALLVYQDAWADLVSRVLDPNIFLDPAFALPLVQHIAPALRPTFLLVWEESDATSFGRLVGLLPLSRRIVPGDRVARGFAHNQVCLGQPLLDRARAAEAWRTLLSWLGTGHGRLALRLRRVPRDGAFFRDLVEPTLGTTTRVIGEHQRACLHRRETEPVAAVACFRSAKRRKEMRRQRRRLADHGERTFVSARSPAEIRRATERFLALESMGWKGGRGSALLEDPGLATFTRSMTRLMAEEGKCRIDSLEIAGRAVAIGIVITAHGHAHFWKTTFDETYAPLSPGVQLALEITEAQLADTSVTTTDSCAAPDHPMIDRLWPDRMSLLDVMIDLHPDEPAPFRAVYAIERLAVASRGRVKAVVQRARAMLRSAGRRADEGRGDADGVDKGEGWRRTGSDSTSGSGLPAS